MRRSDVRVGMEVLVPEWAFGPDEVAKEGITRASVLDVARRWRGEPSIVRVRAGDGRTTTVNVSYLEAV